MRHFYCVLAALVFFTALATHADAVGRDPQRQTAARDVTTRHRQECQNSGSMMQV